MIGERIPEIHVGILISERIRFWLEGTYESADGEIKLQGEMEAFLDGEALEIIQDGTIVCRRSDFMFSPVDLNSGRFGVKDVVIGIGFHWEQTEAQLFKGILKLVPVEGKVRVINVVSVEDYLVSVISSEMHADSAPALLKAHSIISRSWLMAQIEKQKMLENLVEAYKQVFESEDEYMRWYDREDHAGFHICADDHCQRYQGMTKAFNPEVIKAVDETKGEVLIHNGEICDARFSKCCGGVTEKFEFCWEPVERAYLQSIEDKPGDFPVMHPDLKLESNAVSFIKSAPDAYCHTQDKVLLKQVLNDYDQSTSNFFRWKVTYSQEEISGLIREKSGIDFGMIIDLEPVQRGESGRLVKLKIVGTKRNLTIGKELEIRRWLSTSHLLSSAFVVEKADDVDDIPGSFTLHGAGWGHGVGLCQIGAAVMASKGKTDREILKHYFTNASIEKRYEST